MNHRRSIRHRIGTKTYWPLYYFANSHLSGMKLKLYYQLFNYFEDDRTEAIKNELKDSIRETGSWKMI